MLHIVSFTYLVVFVGELPAREFQRCLKQPDSVLTRPLPLKSGRGLMDFALFLFLAPSGTQSEGTRDSIQNPPPTAPPPLPHSLFPVHTILNSSPRNADLSVLHDLICRLLPPLPGIHPHKDWLDLQECTGLPPIVRGQ